MRIENDLLNGFSPVCIFMWFASVLNCRNFMWYDDKENKKTDQQHYNRVVVINTLTISDLTCFSQTLHWNGFSVFGNFIVLLSALDMWILILVPKVWNDAPKVVGWFSSPLTPLHSSTDLTFLFLLNSQHGDFSREVSNRQMNNSHMDWLWNWEICNIFHFLQLCNFLKIQKSI
jgi:hypothetical protein